MKSAAYEGRSNGNESYDIGKSPILAQVCLTLHFQSLPNGDVHIVQGMPTGQRPTSAFAFWIS